MRQHIRFKNCRHYIFPMNISLNSFLLLNCCLFTIAFFHEYICLQTCHANNTFLLSATGTEFIFYRSNKNSKKEKEEKIEMEIFYRNNKDFELENDNKER